jgi:hypothetical protein
MAFYLPYCHIIEPGRYNPYWDHRVPELMENLDNIIKERYSDSTKKRKINRTLAELQRANFDLPGANQETRKLCEVLVAHLKDRYKMYRWGRPKCEITRVRQSRRPSTLTRNAPSTQDTPSTQNALSTREQQIPTPGGQPEQVNFRAPLVQVTNLPADLFYGSKYTPVEFVPVYKMKKIKHSTPVECGICLDLHHEMVETACKHTMCTICIQKLTTNSCPMCRAKIHNS